MDSYSPQVNAEQVLRLREHCRHEHTEIRRRQCADGRIQFVRECQSCYYASSPIKASLARGDEPFVTVIDWNHYGDKRREELQHEREARKNDREAYYRSPQWKGLRNAVMKRDGYQCQECYARATDVHHITYLHFKDERLYELVALCRSCHETLTALAGQGGVN